MKDWAGWLARVGTRKARKAIAVGRGEWKLIGRGADPPCKYACIGPRAESINWVSREKAGAAGLLGLECLSPLCPREMHGCYVIDCQVIN